MPVLHAKSAMWSRKHSVCSAVSGASRCDDDVLGCGIQLYPFAVALRVRVLQVWMGRLHMHNQNNAVYEAAFSSARKLLRVMSDRQQLIVCGIGGMVVGAVGWLEERQKPELGLGVPVGAITVLAAALSVYYSRGFGGWVSARSRSTTSWGVPWRALGPSPCAAVPLTLLWTSAVAGHVAMLAFCARSLLNLGCSSTTCVGVAGAQLSVSITTLAAAVYMLQLDLRFDAALSPPPRPSDVMCTAVSMVPLTSVAINSGNSGDGTTEPSGSPQSKEKEPRPPPEPT